MCGWEILLKINFIFNKILTTLQREMESKSSPNDIFIQMINIQKQKEENYPNIDNKEILNKKL